MKEPPEWALERAAEEANKGPSATGAWDKNNLGSLYIGRAFAAYIAEHEEPPVDPDLLRARELCAEVAKHQNDRAGYLGGIYDGCIAVKAALKALKEKNS